MDYVREIGGQSFWDAWSLVFDRTVPASMIALAIFGISVFALRYRRRAEEAKLRLKEFGEAALITGAVFLIIWAVYFTVITPKRLLGDARRERDGEQIKREIAEKGRNDAQSERDNLKADLLASHGGTQGGTNSAAAVAHKREVMDKLSEFLQEGQHWESVVSNPKLEILPNDQMELWAGKLDAYLRHELGASYAVRARSDAGILPQVLSDVSNKDQQNTWWGLHVRCVRLNQFLEELSKQP